MEKMAAELIPFNLGRLVLEEDATQNKLLMPLDEVYIFNKELFEDKPYAEIRGEVRKPGKYFIDKMTIKDLILKAGDLTDNALLQKGELIWIDKERNRHSTYFSVEKAMAEDPKNNLSLNKEDIVIIHSIWEEKIHEVVSINGQVKTPGEYTLTQSMRLKDLIFRAGQLERNAYLEMGHLYRTDPETREKTILTFNVDKVLADDPADNLLLQDLDKVVIHNLWEYKDQYSVFINGTVNQPGDYPYAENMTVKDLVSIAGNVRSDSYMDEAEIVRYTIVDGKKVEASVIRFNLEKALAGDITNNVRLSPLDVVTIKQVADWLDSRQSVTISGEVHFPGTYQIRKNEHLNDIIQRAGGFTEYAYLRGAVFGRESVRRMQQKRIDEMVAMMEAELVRVSSKEIQSALSEQDIEAQQQYLISQKAVLAKLKSSQASGRVTIKLSRLAELTDSRFDILLEDGDRLHIPKRPSTVNVLGAVYNPNAHVFDQKYPQVKHYLARSGGPTKKRGKKKRFTSFGRTAPS